MSERYSRLFTLPENLYAAGSPVVIAAGALLKDSQTGKVIAQLKMRNISKKPIKAAKVSIQPLDTVGNPLGAKIEYQYLDLNAIRGEDFGQKVPVALADATTRSFTVSVEEIIFADNSIWSATGEPWEVLDVPSSLHSIGDAELIKQFRLKYGNNCKNLPLIEKDLWYCACGELNRQGETECHHCQKAFALLEQIDMDELCKEKDVRVAAEKEQTEREAAAAKAKAKKMGRIAAIVMPLFAVLLAAVVLISNSVKKGNSYENALSLLNAGQYDEAIAIFTELGEYKDCVNQIENANAAKIKSEIEAANANAYLNAKSLLKNGEYDQAIIEFEALGDYQDSKEWALEAKYSRAVAQYEQLKSVDIFEVAVFVVELNIDEELDYWYGDLINFFSEIIDYKDSREKLNQLNDWIALVTYIYETATKYDGVKYLGDGYTFTSDDLREAAACINEYKEKHTFFPSTSFMEFICALEPYCGDWKLVSGSMPTEILTRNTASEKVECFSPIFNIAFNYSVNHEYYADLAIAIGRTALYFHSFDFENTDHIVFEYEYDAYGGEYIHAECTLTEEEMLSITIRHTDKYIGANEFAVQSGTVIFEKISY